MPCQRHVKYDPIEDWYEFFDYSWSEMGLYDTPAHLDKIADVLKSELAVPQRVTYIGYALGATQILYGLAHKEQDYYKEMINGAIALAPCIKLNTPMTEKQKGVSHAFDMYLGYESIFDLYDQIGYVAFQGPNKLVDANKICSVFQENHFQCQRVRRDKYGFGHTYSVKTEKHLQQNMVEGRFQEYSDFYIPGFDRNDNSKQAKQARKAVKRKTDLIPLEKITETPLFFMMSEADKICPPDDVSTYINKFKHKPEQTIYKNLGHNDYVLGSNLIGTLAKDIKKIVFDLQRKDQARKVAEQERHEDL